MWCRRRHQRQSLLDIALSKDDVEIPTHVLVRISTIPLLIQGRPATTDGDIEKPLLLHLEKPRSITAIVCKVH